MNARTQTLPLWASSNTQPVNPQDWRSHHIHLIVDGNIVYYWKHNGVKSWNIGSHKESNPGPEVLLRIL